MLYQKIQLDETDENVFLECFVADKIKNYVRDAMLVIPGGAYGGMHRRLCRTGSMRLCCIIP